MSDHDPPHLKSRERIPTCVRTTAGQVAREVARQIAALIRARAAEGRHAVLGLPSGSTPTGVYEELVRLHREEGLSFRNVITFNLDEFFPMQPHELQSYVRFMKEHLLDHIDIEPDNVHIPDGTLSPEAVSRFCDDYEKAIVDAGGIDVQLLGIGRTGHIGFNEPGSPRNSRTRLIWLDKLTRLDAAGDFFGVDHVPRRAITMGVGTILDARKVILMAFGEGKAPIIAQAVEEAPTPAVAASFLQEHPDARVMLDEPAAEKLTRRACPWLLGPLSWDARLKARAVIWLAQRVSKPILKLTGEDYNENGLQALVAEYGPGYDINLEVFRQLQGVITGWPAGKPRHARQPGDVTRPHDEIHPKRILIFSPHPDDDVISMGGTLRRLVEQGHDVHVAYQTSGNIAVFDDDAIRFSDFAVAFNRLFNIDEDRSSDIEQHVERFLKNKQPGQVDSGEVLALKGLVRKGEARAAARYCGVPLENVHFLELPFYETGKVRKNPLGGRDIEIVHQLLQAVQPHQVYAAGDLSDPHGTHRTCLAAVCRAIEQCCGASWFDACEIWLYRGAWQEWEPQQIEMAVPLSPEELMSKRKAIFKHESQKDKALFPGIDEREFWQRAEDRNRTTAILYDRLGLAEYEAIEGFVKWDPAHPLMAGTR